MHADTFWHDIHIDKKKREKKRIKIKRIKIKRIKIKRIKIKRIKRIGKKSMKCLTSTS